MKAAALQLDFLARPRSIWRALGWAALAAALLLSAWVGERYLAATQMLAAAQSRNEQLAARLQSAGPERTLAAPDAQTLADIQRANLIIEQLTVPWDALFDSVEAADARGLGLLSLTPNARDRSLRLAGESRSMRELLDYVNRMSAQPALSQVHLLGYSTALRDGVSVFSFTLAATWRQAP